jgi:hypothetical protein
VFARIRPIGDFVQYEPDNGKPATEQTELWILVDDRHLYVAGRAHDSAPEDRWVINEMRRDIPNVSARERIGFSIDTFHDRRNGFLFELNALGGFLDAQITNESSPPNANWNAVWDSRVGRFDGGWTFEIAIPFRSLRYRPGTEQVWGFNMRRVVRWKNEESHIVPVPPSMGQRRGLMQVSLNAALVGIEAPSGGKNLEVRPFAIGSVATDVPTRRVNDRSADVGLDVKYGVTQNLTADFTLNTDFAQVEVDEQQVNLTRFSLVYPEKRTFFLEGQGIFNFGVGAGNSVNAADVPVLFFSRRIGLSQNLPVPIVGGGRLTGRVGTYTVGALHMQTDDAPEAGAVATGFSVVRLKRDVLRRSAIGLLFTDRSSSIVAASGRSRTYGADGTFSFLTDLTVNSYLARTDTPGRSGDNLSYRGQLNYAGDRYGLVLERLVIDPQFNPEVGFLRRPNLRKWAGGARFSPRPRTIRRVRKYLYEASGSYIENHAGVVESKEWIGTFGLDLNNGDSLRIDGIQTFDFLARPFLIDPRVTIPDGGNDFSTPRQSYTLGAQRRFAATTSVERGSFYGGTKTTVTVSGGRLEMTNRLQVQPGVSLNWVDLPVGRFSATQVQARAVYTLTPRMFVAALAQYSSSLNVVGTNLRLRWEYRPGSELFVVYTDERNSLTSGLPDLTNRAFVVKLAPLLQF